MSDGQLALNTNLASPGLFLKDSNGDAVKVGPVHVGTTAPNATPAAGGQAGNSKGEMWLDNSGSDYTLKTWDGSAWREIVVTSAMIKDGTIVNADVNASAAIAHTKLANITAGNVLLGNASNVPTSTALSGDVTVSNAGVTAIGSGVIVNADVNASAAIAGTKISPNFGSQNIATTGNLQVTSINGGPLAGFRNAIINGNFDHWQRGTSFGSLASLAYNADRWHIAFNGGGTRAITRQAFPIGQSDVQGDPTYYLNWDQTVAGSGQTINDLRQKIENVRTFAGQEVTVSLWAKASAPINSNGVRIVQDFGTGGTPSATVTKSSGVFSLTTSWAKYSFTTTLDSISGKTLGSNGNDNLYVSIRMPLNVTFNIDIAQVQIEAGPVATPFERRPIGTELALCQRYYLLSTANNTNIQRRWAGSAVGNSTLGQTFFPVTMRAVPTVSTSAVTYINSSSLASAPVTTHSVSWYCTVTAAAAIYGAIWDESTFDAEL